MNLFAAPFLETWTVRVGDPNGGHTVARGFTTREAAEAWIEGYRTASGPSIVAEAIDTLRAVIDDLQDVGAA